MPSKKPGRKKGTHDDREQPIAPVGRLSISPVISVSSRSSQKKPPMPPGEHYPLEPPQHMRISRQTMQDITISPQIKIETSQEGLRLRASAILERALPSRRIKTAVTRDRISNLAKAEAIGYNEVGGRKMASLPYMRNGARSNGVNVFQEAFSVGESRREEQLREEQLRETPQQGATKIMAVYDARSGQNLFDDKTTRACNQENLDIFCYNFPDFIRYTNADKLSQHAAVVIDLAFFVQCRKSRLFERTMNALREWHKDGGGAILFYSIGDEISSQVSQEIMSSLIASFPDCARQESSFIEIGNENYRVTYMLRMIIARLDISESVRILLPSMLSVLPTFFENVSSDDTPTEWDLATKHREMLVRFHTPRSCSVPVIKISGFNGRKHCGEKFVYEVQGKLHQQQHSSLVVRVPSPISQQREVASPQGKHPRSPLAEVPASDSSVLVMGSSSDSSSTPSSHSGGSSGYSDPDCDTLAPLERVATSGA